jgi:hypothetical protein
VPNSTATGASAAAMNENLSLIVMCFFLVASIAFLADQIISYH